MSAPTGADGARVRCLYCGANNFTASPVCWQCSRPLRALPIGADAAPTPVQSSSSPSPAAPSVYPALAAKSAAALGLMFPAIALPVGMVFLMLDDPRKAQLGWITIGWSVVGTVLNVIFFAATMGLTLALIKSLLPGSGHGAIPGLPAVPGGETENIIVTLAAIFPHLPTLFHG